MRKSDHVVYGKNREEKETDQNDLQILTFSQKNLCKIGIRAGLFSEEIHTIKRSQIFEIETSQTS